MAGPRTTLVVNADDFGLSEGIDRGIQSAFRQGILRSASLMPNGSAFDDAVRIACDTPGLGVGIHLSLVDEHCIAPLAEVEGLADEAGRLPRTYSAFVRSFILRRFGIQQVRAEIEAQVRRVLDAGIKPTHLDSHQHLHIFPSILTVVLDVAKTVGIPVVRLPLDQSCRGLPFGGRGIQGKALSLLCRRAAPRISAARLRRADFFWGFEVSGQLDEANLKLILNRLGEGVNEVMCHPGFSDSATKARYPWGYRWDDEAAALMSESVCEMVRDRGIRLANFRDAWGGHIFDGSSPLRKRRGGGPPLAGRR